MDVEEEEEEEEEDDGEGQTSSFLTLILLLILFLGPFGSVLGPPALLDTPKVEMVFEAIISTHSM